MRKNIFGVLLLLPFILMGMPKHWHVTYKEKEITYVFKAKLIDVPNANELLSQYLDDSTITRQRKLDFLYNLANYYHNNASKLNYLLGGLGYLHPTELADWLINLYKTTKSDVIRIHLRKILVSLAEPNLFASNEPMSVERRRGVMKIRHFLEEQRAERYKALAL